MINADTVYNVLNRSSSMVGYTIPELNIRREFQPSETKKIKFSELEQLTPQPTRSASPLPSCSHRSSILRPTML